MNKFLLALLLCGAPFAVMAQDLETAPTGLECAPVLAVVGNMEPADSWPTDTTDQDLAYRWEGLSLNEGTWWVESIPIQISAGEYDFPDRIIAEGGDAFDVACGEMGKVYELFAG